MTIEVARTATLDYQELGGKLFLNIKHKNFQRQTRDESYYSMIFATDSFISEHEGEFDFFLGAPYIDKQIYLAMEEAENLVILLCQNISQENADHLATSFIEKYDAGFEMNLRLLQQSYNLTAEDIENKKSAKMPLTKGF